MGLISEETIQRVVEANDIVDVVGSYFPLKRAGSNFRALCPFHREKSPSFHVTPSRQSFHCFGCGAGGGVLRFVMDYERVDFPTAVRRLAARAGIVVVEDEGGEQVRSQRQRLLALHAEAADWFHGLLLKSPEADAARAYLKKRGVGAEIARNWQLGYAPTEPGAITEFLSARRYTGEEITASGLVSENDRGTYGRFRHRVMFPIRNDHGEVIGFSGRVLDPDAKAAKYVNSPETPLFSKGKVLYGLDKTKRDLIEKNAAIVCEGQLDLIAAYESGVRNVIAPQGTAFTPEQARLLKRFVETVLLCFDSDSAGQKAAARSLPALLSIGLQVRVVILPDGEDPDSLIRKNGPEAFLERVESARDYFDHVLTKAESAGVAADPAARARLVKSLGAPLALIPDLALREATLGTISSRLGVPQAAVRAAMKPPEVPGEPEADVPAETLPTLPPGVTMLCQLALASREVRDWLRSRPEAEMAALPGGDLLGRIVAADFEDSPTGLSAFLATLGGTDERFVSSLLSSKPTSDPLPRAIDTWRGIEAGRLRERIESLQSSLGRPGLDGETVSGLQKQILDLKIRVNDLLRPSA